MTEGNLGGAATALEIARHLREVPDFPKPGISFKDITPLIENGPAFHAAVDRGSVLLPPSSLTTTEVDE